MGSSSALLFLFWLSPDITLDLPETEAFGSSEDSWLKNAEIYLATILDKDESNDVSENNLNAENLNNDV